MGRRNLGGGWGETRTLSIRLTAADWDALRVLKARWPEVDGVGAVIRRAILEAARSLAGPTA